MSLRKSETNGVSRSNGSEQLERRPEGREGTSEHRLTQNRRKRGFRCFILKFFTFETRNQKWDLYLPLGARLFALPFMSRSSSRLSVEVGAYWGYNLMENQRRAYCGQEEGPQGKARAASPGRQRIWISFLFRVARERAYGVPSLPGGLTSLCRPMDCNLYSCTIPAEAILSH